MNLSNATLKEWDDDLEDIVVKQNRAIDTVTCGEDSLELVFDDEDVSSLEIPMTPSNIRVLKRQVFMSDNTVVKNTDSKGRFNLGVDYSDQELEVLINESE